MINRVLLMCALLAFAASTAFADSTTINFDDVAGGTQVNNQYQSAGLSLTCESNTSGAACATGSNAVYASTYLPTSDPYYPGAHSPSNVLDLTSQLTYIYGTTPNYIVGTFASGMDVTGLSVWALPNCSDCSGLPSSGPTLQIFDASGNYINAFAVSPAGGLGTSWEQITASSSTAIGSFALYDTGDLYGSVWDDLTFTTGTTSTGGGGGGTPVPEPSSLVLLGSGLLGVFAKLRK